MFFRQIHSRLRKTSSGKFTRGIHLAGVSGNICAATGGSIAMVGDVAKIFFLWFLLLPELISLDVDGLEIRIKEGTYEIGGNSTPSFSCRVKTVHYSYLPA